jgi:hypothetical protein
MAKRSTGTMVVYLMGLCLILLEPSFAGQLDKECVKRKCIELLYNRRTLICIVLVLCIIYRYLCYAKCFPIFAMVYYFTIPKLCNQITVPSKNDKFSSDFRKS